MKALSFFLAFLPFASLVAAMAVHDAGLVDTQKDAQLFALRIHLPAILDALAHAVVDAEYQSQAKRYRAALEALSAEEGKRDG